MLWKMTMLILVAHLNHLKTRIEIHVHVYMCSEFTEFGFDVL